MPEHDEAQTQPLPAVRRCHSPLAVLSACGAVAWLLGGALLAAEYAPIGANAPRLARGVVWAVCCGSLALGLAALCCATTIVLVRAVVNAAREIDRGRSEERRSLYRSSAPQLALQRDRGISLAALAASVREDPARKNGLHVVGGQRTRSSRSRSQN